MARDWCFTSFDTDKELEFEKDSVRYIIYGREKCPKTGREHYQGYAIFKRTCRMPKAKVWIGGGDGVHLESRRGSRDQARDYCRKDGDVFEWGKFDGMTKEELFDQPISYLKENHKEFYCRYHRGLEKLNVTQGPKWRDVECTLIYGGSGKGKTRYVMEMDDVYKIDRPYRWFDFYEGHDILCIDDFALGEMARGFFLNLLDGYRLRLETKGGFVFANWTKVFVTSNYDMDGWDNAMRRRINHVIDIDDVTS